jgi:hypothetical protein
MWLIPPAHEKYRPYYAHYLCRVWNQDPAHAEKISAVQIYFNAELIPPNYLDRRADRMLLIEEACPGVR